MLDSQDSYQIFLRVPDALILFHAVILYMLTMGVPANSEVVLHVADTPKHFQLFG